MNILVCVKHVADTTEVRVDSATGAPHLRGVPTKVSDYDKNAVEAAVQIKESTQAAVTVVSVGPREAIKTLKESLAMGADHGLLVTGPWVEALDPLATSAVLATVASQYGPFDLILCGEVSEDGYNAQVGPALAERLQWPHIAYVESLSVTADQVTAARRAGHQVETISAPYPVVLTVNRKLNRPRLPTAIQILKVQATRIRELRAAELGLDDTAGAGPPPTYIVGYRAATVSRKNTVLDGEATEAVRQLVALLDQEGVR